MTDMSIEKLGLGPGTLMEICQQSGTSVHEELN